MKNFSGSRFFKIHSCFRTGILTIAAIISMFSSAWAQFEKIADVDGSDIAHQLPEIVSPKNATAKNYILQTSGVLAQTPSDIIQTEDFNSNNNNIVSAQYRDNTHNDWEQKHIVLPSVRLVQGLTPTKVASVGRSPINASPYRGAERVLQNDVFTETNSSTSGIQTPRRLSELPPKPPVMKQRISTEPNQSEILWEENERQTLPQENNGYEVLSEQFGNSDDERQNLYTPNVYDQYVDPYGAIYGGVNNYGYYDYNSQLPGVYGNEMYGYSGVCPPLFAPGYFSAALSYIMYSNAWENLTIGFGGSGFKSPLDRVNGGAFGFQESVNWTSPSNFAIPVNFQAGFRAMQAYPSGYQTETGNWRRDNREQYFGTIGVFRRNLFDRPIHLGVAYDVVKDKYFRNYRLEQLRSEIAFGTMYGAEYGYRGTKQLRGGSIRLQQNTKIDIRAASYHTLFIKKYFANGGEGLLAGGATESGDPIIRAEYNIPLSNEWELKNSLMYLIPKNGHSLASPQKESWDVSLQLIYKPHGGVLAGFCNPFRAFFDVGDNSTLLQQTR
ncbi:MAG: hypothetical protein LBT05_10760 [Planctomycetaceae bacterium]|nr:hypothetical protein [Planctomycetaceae bacterium]